VTRVSRSAMEDRQLCEQRRFLGYHWDGTGLAPAVTPRALQLGTDLHDLMPLLWRGLQALDLGDELLAGDAHLRLLADFHAAAEAAYPEPTQEQVLAFALAYAWADYRLREVHEEWEVLSVEEPWAVSLGPRLQQPLRMDVLLRHRYMRGVGTLDFKTMTTYRPDWYEKFSRDLQTLTYVRALETTGVPVLGIQFEGLVKGKYEAPKTGACAGQPLYGSVLVSPYKTKEGALTGLYKPGLTRVSLTTFAEVVTWQEVLRQQEPDVVPAQLTTVPLQKPSRWVMQTVLDPLVRAEEAFAAKLATGEPVERTPAACLKFGADHPCPFLAMCWDQTVATNPLDSGLYVRRVDHHAPAQEPAA